MAFVYLFATTTTSKHSRHVGLLHQQHLGMYPNCVLAPHGKLVIVFHVVNID